MSRFPFSQSSDSLTSLGEVLVLVGSPLLTSPHSPAPLRSPSRLSNRINSGRNPTFAHSKLGTTSSASDGRFSLWYIWRSIWCVVVPVHLRVTTCDLIMRILTLTILKPFLSP